MRLEITKQDRCLISILLALAVAAAWIFLGIMPLYRLNREMEARLELAESDAREGQRKLTGLAELKSAGEDLKEEFREAGEGIYPVMESQEIDRILTEMVLECGLSARRMEISMPYRLYPGETDDKGAEPGIFRAQVLLEVTGSREDKDALLDRIARIPKSLRLLTMRRLKTRIRTESGSVQEELDVMELKLEIIMCRKE